MQANIIERVIVVWVIVLEFAQVEVVEAGAALPGRRAFFDVDVVTP